MILRPLCQELDINTKLIHVTPHKLIFKVIVKIQLRIQKY